MKKGFKPGSLDPNLFTKSYDGELFVCQVYVDDNIFGCTDQRYNDEFAYMWHRVNKPLHQAEITTRNRLSRPQPNYDILHGSARYPMQLGPLGHLFIQQQRAL